MSAKDFSEVVNLILRSDGRYDPGAYFLVHAALDFTVKKIIKAGGKPRHMSGSELCEGFRDHVVEQYGPMSYTLLNTWGIHSTADIGEIVYNLIDYDVFSRTEEDKRSDFEAVYTFEEAFIDPFLPVQKKGLIRPNPLP
jgi:uncharacterized repeat protein (TIGR04138 family)